MKRTHKQTATKRVKKWKNPGLLNLRQLTDSAARWAHEDPEDRHKRVKALIARYAPMIGGAR